MEKKMRLSLLSLITLAIVAVLIYSTNISVSAKNQVNEGNKSLSTEEFEFIKSLTPNNVTGIDAVYVDGSRNIEELKQNSALIIKGKVISNKIVNEIAAVSIVKVLDTLQGNKFDYVYIHQLNNDDVLAEQEYILFLGKQNDDKTDTFHIKGGTQGIFVEKDSTVTAVHHTMTTELEKINNISETVRSVNNAALNFENWIKK
ncbi:hypothetical protein [Paenibacillus sp. NPDC058174]|uniref:hypothetical protein n=1 Tax=Paenibacillus sp. NPDC058174 TaxID=3346366 RepID=UPI0036DD5A5C